MSSTAAGGGLRKKGKSRQVGKRKSKEDVDQSLELVTIEKPEIGRDGNLDEQPEVDGGDSDPDFSGVVEEEEPRTKRVRKPTKAWADYEGSLKYLRFEKSKSRAKNKKAQQTQKEKRKEVKGEKNTPHTNMQGVSIRLLYYAVLFCLY